MKLLTCLSESRVHNPWCTVIRFRGLRFDGWGLHKVLLYSSRATRIPDLRLSKLAEYILLSPSFKVLTGFVTRYKRLHAEWVSWHLGFALLHVPISVWFLQARGRGHPPRNKRLDVRTSKWLWRLMQKTRSLWCLEARGHNRTFSQSERCQVKARAPLLSSTRRRSNFWPMRTLLN